LNHAQAHGHADVRSIRPSKPFRPQGSQRAMNRSSRSSQDGVLLRQWLIGRTQCINGFPGTQRGPPCLTSFKASSRSFRTSEANTCIWLAPVSSRRGRNILVRLRLSDPPLECYLSPVVNPADVSSPYRSTRCLSHTILCSGCSPAGCLPSPHVDYCASTSPLLS